MKKLNLLFLIGTLIGSSLLFTSCGDDDETTPPPAPPAADEIIVDANITSDVTWTADKTVILANRIAVVDGVTLTIEAGTLIKGQAGTGANATALIIARGGKIQANGTAAAPIIMTSIADEITREQIASGDFKSPNLDPDQDGLWGGLLVLGRAPISADAASVQIEGIPPSDTNGLYGGSDASDNSGSITYLSLRHGGSNIGEGNEINGITLGGVGSATVIENVEVVANQDDGIEWFGGTVNVTNALVWNSGDDAMDTDQEWAGTLDNFIIICNDATDHALELDGGEGTLTGAVQKIKNGSARGVYSEDNGSAYADLRDGVVVELENVYFFGFQGGADFEIDDVESGDNYTAGTTKLTGLKFNTSHMDPAVDKATIAEIMDDTKGNVFANITTAEAEVVNAKGSAGADAAVFGWTWAGQASALTGF